MLLFICIFLCCVIYDAVYKFCNTFRLSTFLKMATKLISVNYEVFGKVKRFGFIKCFNTTDYCLNQGVGCQVLSD